MLRNLNQSSGGKRIMGVPQVGILAATIAANTATGDNGPGLLYDDSLLSGNSGKQLRCRITGYTGTLSALFVNEDGSFTLTGEADGSYTISYAVDADAVQVLTDTATVYVGVINASVGAASGTSIGTGSGGSATGIINSDASGGAGTSTGTGSGGDPAGGAGTNASTAAGTGTSTGFGSGGTAVGDANGSAPGGTGTGAGSGIGGSGNQNLTSHPHYIIKAPARRFIISK